jgi:hypothetical protein
MLPSRGMGAIAPSKMPKAKTIVRKDDPNDVTMYKKGGKVKRYDGSNGSQTTLDDPIVNAIDEETDLQEQARGSKKGGKIKLKRKKK